MRSSALSRISRDDHIIFRRNYSSRAEYGVMRLAPAGGSVPAAARGGVRMLG
jgi:hypothetical protein